MTTPTLTDEQWDKLCAFLRGETRVYVGQEEACRRFVEAVIWMSRSGEQWRLLPKNYGQWNSVYKRFGRWCEHGVWERMLHHEAEFARQGVSYRVKCLKVNRQIDRVLL